MVKRLIVFSLVIASLIGFNAASAFAHPQGDFKQVQQVVEQYGLNLEQFNPQRAEKLINDLLSQLNYLPAQPPPSNQPSHKVKPATPVQTEQPSSKKEQPAPSTNQALTKEEQQMVNLVNQEREKQGLQPLKVNTELVKVARLKAKDMIAKHYFDHHSPTYGYPDHMLQQFGISYRVMGENIAGHQSLEGAHNGLMNSPKHRENILNSQFTEVGIGIVNGGPYGKMFVQLFKG